MTAPAIETLRRMTERASAFIPAAPPAAPSGGALDAELRGQRLRLISIASFSLGTAGAFWALGQGVVALGESDNERMRFAVSVLQSLILAAGGWTGFYRSRRRQLRRATYCNVSALILSATINLAFIRNAEGAAVAAYAAAVGLAALVIRDREWLWWGGILVVSTLTGSLLHSVPLLPQFELPHALATAGLISAATLGLTVPMGLFWLFSHDLTASHDRAWAFARQAAEAQQLANQRAGQLEHRTAQLQAKNAELNDFLYVVSHDLRAPLINLEGFSRALQDSMTALDQGLADARPAQWPELRRDIGESLDFIVRSTDKMDFLVQGLLELSRIDSRPNPAQPIDLGRQVAEILDSLQYTIGERGIAVRVDPLPVMIGDPVRISQVFGNLIDNAVKYMKPNGDATIHIGCTERDGHLQFFVRDSGVGIRPEDHARIFRLFSRVGGHAVPGDGMGLTTVKKIVEKQGGRIWVESALGQGSTFWFTLSRHGTADEREEDERGLRTATDHDSVGRG
jgi:signal transduction histidine kinase